MQISELEDVSRKLRREAIEMLYQAQSGHPGSALSTMDLLVALYFGGVLKYDTGDIQQANNDYFLLSNGHACPAWYAVLAEAGFFSKSLLQGLRQLDSPTQGHPHRGSLPGVAMSSGSLGQGLSVGIGLAYAQKYQGNKNGVYVMMSDGEHEEGSTWEAVMYAPKRKLDNLIAIVDKNKYQIDGATIEVMPGLDSLADKYRAFNWQVIDIDGHDFKQILEAFTKARSAKGPCVIIADTVRGKGVSYMEHSEHWHAGALSEDEYRRAMADLVG